jgi:L-asparaginase/Glu-tRNA(Gln) amidotransferase subunit D
MANQSAAITQSALTRILKAHRDAGIPVVRTEIGRDGKVVVYSTERDQDGSENPWDKV